MLITSDEKRYLSFAASRTIDRTSGISGYSTPRPRAYVSSFSATTRTN